MVDLAGDTAVLPEGKQVIPRHQHDHAWLDYIDEDNCFVPLALDDSQPSKTLDFGCDGYTGSLSIWHELLQLTAPDAECGLVFVRGDFPDHADAILARAQRRNQRGTFGMTIRTPEDQEWAQEPTAAQGLVNVRWPYTRFNWVRESGAAFATFSVCSFVKDGTLYQIARIAPRTPAQSSLASSSVNLADKSPRTKKPVVFEIVVGGLVRFGCPSTVGSATYSTLPADEASRVFEDVYKTRIERPNISVTTKNPKEVAPAYTCTGTHHEKRLEIRLWINRAPQNPSDFRHMCEAPRPEEVASVHIRRRVEFDNRKTTVIVAAFRLVDSDAELKPMASVGHDEVLMHLGVADNSPQAPYRLWSAVLGSFSGADSFELNTVARSIETILGVATLPVAPSRNGEPASIAMLRNIITPQVVDLESAFWQVRLLITAAERMKEKPQLPSISQYRWLEMQYDLMRDRYRKKIVHNIRGFCVWILDLFDSVRDFDRPSPQIRDPRIGILPSDVHQNQKRQCRPDPGLLRLPIGDQKYFGAIIISYVLSRLPEVFDRFDVQSELWEKASSLFGAQTSYKPTTASKIHHHQSRPNPATICHVKAPKTAHGPPIQPRPDEPSDSTERTSGSWTTVDFALLRLAEIQFRVKEWQVITEKAMQMFEKNPLRGRELGYATANLAKVGLEWGIDPTAITLRGVSCLELSKSLIKRRKATEKLNAGRAHILRWDSQHDLRSAKTRSGPWELSCLAQHLAYALGVGDCERDKCLERIRMFMFSDYSFMGSWDLSKTTTIGQWWDYITTCIISAKLLDDSICSRQKQQNLATKQGTDTDDVTSIRREGLDLLRDIYELQRKANIKTDGIFQWKALRPKQLYFPDTSVLSVEDTPRIQKMHQRPGVDVLATRLNLGRYFEWHVLPRPMNILDSIKANTGASKLHNLSCLDIALVTDCNGNPGTSPPIIRGRAENRFWDEWIQEDGPGERLRTLFTHPITESLKDLYFIGRAYAHPFFNKHRDVLMDRTMRDDLLEKYRNRLFTRLNDCFRGSANSGRFVKRFSPVTLQAMAYLWHPEAIDAFDAHLGELSNFRDVIDQSVTGSDNTWRSSITIKHWRLLDDEEAMVRGAERDVDEKERIARWDRKWYFSGDKSARWPFPRGRTDPSLKKPLWEQDKNCDFPPPGVRDERAGSPLLLWNMHELNEIHELSISLAITGDAMGRGWTCSIICELFDEKDVISYTTQASYILQMFIHQQDAARALVFLMLLGNICLVLARECGKFIEELNGLMHLDLNPDQALKKLKQMLWGFELLRLYNDMLKRAIGEIGKARDTMNKFLEGGSVIRDEEMKSAALQIQEEFDKKFSLLEAMHDGVEQRVEQGYKLREGITSILSIEQNENISMLAWLTIIYLGPSLGLFGMSNNAILNDDSSANFYRLLGGLLGGTLLFALCLSTIIAIIRFFWRLATYPVRRVWGTGKHSLMRTVTFAWKYRNYLFWTSPWKAREDQWAAWPRDIETTSREDDGVAVAASQRA
ncbi:hypothetical protein QBC34DRAFT_429266 [Podospora aff. communis PSN243]|uniref:Uncharacterized protein n=1 Tax=Podospora aff. communis PSN243 TaxID=3040156 RepID=A0AAV9GAJ1_9PEZI|nr:hypothetical protein QBC34DRAFT_429266 [Podospora aff. communis PSN243]